MVIDLLPLDLRRKPDGKWLYPMLGRDCSGVLSSAGMIHPIDCLCGGTGGRVAAYTVETLLEAASTLTLENQYAFARLLEKNQSLPAKEGWAKTCRFIVWWIGLTVEQRHDYLEAALLAVTEETELPPDATYLFREAGDHA